MGGEENILPLMARLGIAVVVETLGSRGARCYWNGQVFSVDGLPTECVDATGAGDAFWGAFLARLLRGGVTRRADFTQALLREAMVFGNVAGRLCVREKGAIESLPTWEQILSMKEELGL